MNADGTMKRQLGGVDTDDEWCGASDPATAEVPVWEPKGHKLLVSVDGFQPGGAGVYEKNLDSNKLRRAAATQYAPEWLVLASSGSTFAFITGTCSLVRVVSVENGSHQETSIPRAWSQRSAPAIWLQ